MNDVCSACHVDYYYNPNIRILFSAICDHRVCESCVKRLFQRGPYKCPACDRQLRASDFNQEAKEARQVDSEVKVRRQIRDIFCKSADDFENAEQWDDYLCMREDIIYRLVNAPSQDEVQQTWKEIEEYREKHAEQIRREQRMAPRRKFRKLTAIIKEEGAFFGNINAEVNDQGPVPIPLQVRHREFLARPLDDPEGGKKTPPMSPVPVPMGGKPKDLPRHKSAGGYSDETCVNKARHFFFADLALATVKQAKVS